MDDNIRDDTIRRDGRVVFTAERRSSHAAKQDQQREVIVSRTAASAWQSSQRVRKSVTAVMRTLARRWRAQRKTAQQQPAASSRRGRRRHARVRPATVFAGNARVTR